jgi:hypothetical protein
MGQPVDYDPFATTQAPKGQSVDYDPFAAPKAKVKDEGFTIEKIPGEALSNLESYARGGLVSAAAGFPSIIGLPGTVEQVGRAGLRKLGADVSPSTLLPTMGEIYQPISEIAKKIIPRATKPTTEAAGFEEIGEAIGFPIGGGAGVSAARKTGELTKRALPGSVKKAQEELSKVGKATGESQLGERMEESLNRQLKDVMATRSKNYKDLMDKAVQEGLGKESKVIDAYNRYIKNELATKRGEINKDELSLIQEVANNLRGEKNVRGIEKEIRRLKDIADTPKISPGYSSIISMKAKDIADVLQKEVDLIAKSAAKARDVYQTESAPVNVYDFMLGRKALEGELDPAKLPQKFFQTPFTVSKLKQLVKDPAEVDVYAKNFIANELNGKTGKQAQTWLSNNKEWINSVGGGLPNQVENYVNNLARTENAVSTRNKALIGLGLTGASISGLSSLKSALGF